MYALGGTIIERVSGMPWDAFIRDADLRAARHERDRAARVGDQRQAERRRAAREVGDSVRVVPMR